MTLLAFFVVLIIIILAIYVLRAFVTPPRPIEVLIYVVAGLVVLFMVLALFKVMPLPFDLK